MYLRFITPFCSTLGFVLNIVTDSVYQFLKYFIAVESDYQPPKHYLFQGFSDFTCADM
jgi:hypothetical protein